MSQEGSERRLSTRHEVRCEASLSPINEAVFCTPNLQVTIIELSRTGVMLLSSEALEINSEWRLIILKDGYLQHTQPIIIKRVKSIKDGSGYLSGAMFVIEHCVLQLLDIDLDSDNAESIRNIFDQDIQSLEELFQPATD